MADVSSHGAKILDFDTIWFGSPGLSPDLVAFLTLCSAMTSMLTATAGVGGGVLLFAIMAWVMPLAALIPVHGVVQIGSNVGRLMIMLQHVRLSVLVPFLIGSVIGGTLGAFVVVQLPPTAMQIALGGFILWAAWMKPLKMKVDRRVITLTGFFVTFLTMFFGATAPLISAVLKLLRLDRLSHVATQSACVIAQHGIKVAAFGLMGFAFGPYLPLIAVMIAAGFVGTLIGNNLLRKIADQRFHVMLSCVLTVLALGLLTKGVSALIVSPGEPQDRLAALELDDQKVEAQPNHPGTQHAKADNRSVGEDGKDMIVASSNGADMPGLPPLYDNVFDRQGPETMKGLFEETLAADKAQSGGQSRLAYLEAENRKLRENLSTTRAVLAIVDERAIEMKQERDAIAEQALKDQEHIATLEKELKVSQELVQEFRDQVGDIGHLGF